MDAQADPSLRWVHKSFCWFLSCAGSYFLLQIRLHEHWRDTTAVTWFLHEALEYHFPDEISRISVVIESPDTQKDIQPINVTDCIKLQYQVYTLVLTLADNCLR